jgi:hypothetical protein
MLSKDARVGLKILRTRATPGYAEDESLASGNPNVFEWYPLS